MASYYVNTLAKSPTGKAILGLGSFNNFTIDGRLSLDNAISVARHHAKKECNFKNREYIGFAIEKGDSIGFNNPMFIDCDPNIIDKLNN